MKYFLSIVVGGFLMGLANLVPGISGGTMLLAVGLYPKFIDALSKVTRFQFSKASLGFLFLLGAVAASTVLFGAGAVKDLVVSYRWIMYSLFIGLTFGGIPILLKLIDKKQTPFFVGAIVTFVLMLVMAFTQVSNGGGSNLGLLLLTGVAGSSAMILPGISGGYLFLLLGQYETILGAIDTLKNGDITGSLGVIIPVGIGAVLGVVVVSNLIRLLLDKYHEATIGALFGLLVGAVAGIWPFQEGAEEVTVYFNPTFLQLIISSVLIAAGYCLTQVIEKLGNNS